MFPRSVPAPSTAPLSPSSYVVSHSVAPYISSVKSSERYEGVVKQGQVSENPLDEDEDECAEGEYNVEVDVGLGSTSLMGVGTPQVQALPSH